MTPALNLHLLDGHYSVCRLSPEEPLPAWGRGGPLWSFTQTAEELSLLCATDRVPTSVRSEGPFRALKVAGPLDFALTGILSSLAQPLAEAGIPIFVTSTFDTDYLLVKADRLEATLGVLREAGHRVP